MIIKKLFVNNKIFFLFFVWPISLLFFNSTTEASSAKLEKKLDQEITDELNAIQQPQIEWFAPRVSVGSSVYSSKVFLYGRTNPYTRVGIDHKNIIIIKRESNKSTDSPKKIRPLATANSKGLFYVTVELPNGLVQVPIVTKSNVGRTKPIILSMQISNKIARMNTKVLKWVPQKKVHLVEDKTTYDLKMGLGIYSLDHKYNAQGFKPLSLKSSNSPYFSFIFSSTFKNWEVFSTYGTTNMSVSQSDDTFKIEDKKNSVNIFSLGGQRSVFTKNVYGSFEVVSRQQPLAAIGSTLDLYLYNFVYYTVSLGGGYKWDWEKFSSNIGLNYEQPFLLNSLKGEFSYDPNYIIRTNLMLSYAIAKSWQLSFDMQYLLQKYDYRIDFVPQSVSNHGSAEIKDIITQFQLQYKF